MISKAQILYIIKYWSFHRRKCFTLLSSIIIMVAMLCSILLLNRTDNRRELHHNYDRVGAFDYEFCDVDQEFISLIDKSDYVTDSGLYYVFGTLYCGDYFPVGAFDETAKELMHYPISEGRLPEQEGEIALTDALRNSLCLGAEINADISLPLYDLDKNLIGEKSYRLVGIIDQSVRDSFIISSTDQYAQPQALVRYEDALSYPDGYYNLVCMFQGDGIVALVPFDDPRFTEFLDFKQSLPEFSISPWGRLSDFQRMSGSLPGYETGENVPATNKTRIIQIIAVFAIIIASIALYSGISVVLQQREASFRVLHRVGFSRIRIKMMLCIEASIMLLIGILTGFMLGIIIYEGILWIQRSFLDMPNYKGYSVEWIVRNRTIDPWITAGVAAFVSTFIAYLIPIVRIGKEHSELKKYRKNHNSLYQIMKAIISQRKIEIIQAISLICVLVSTMLGYLYCTSNGKDSVMLSGVGNIRDQIVSKDYLSDNGLDLRELEMDCELSTKGSKEASYMSMYIQSGIPNSVVDQLIQSNTNKVYAYSYEFHLLFYSEGADDVFGKYNLDTIFSDLFQTDQTIAAVPCVILSDSLLNELSTFSDVRLLDGMLYVSPKDEESVGVRKVLCAKGDQNGWYPAQMEDKTVAIAQTIHVDNSLLADCPVLQKALSGMENQSYVILPGSYAQKIGLYQQTYDVLLLSMGDNSSESNLTRLISDTIPANSFMRLQSIYMMKRNYIKQSIVSYATIITVFVLLLVVHLIGYCNVLNLQLQNKLYQFSILRSLGMSKKQLLLHLSAYIMKVPVISALLSSVIVLFFHQFMLHQYEIYQNWDETMNEIGLTQYQFANLYMLNAGMWMPDWRLPMLILAVVVCGFSIISILMLLRRQTDKEIITTIRTGES